MAAPARVDASEPAAPTAQSRRDSRQHVCENGRTAMSASTQKRRIVVGRADASIAGVGARFEPPRGARLSSIYRGRRQPDEWLCWAHVIYGLTHAMADASTDTCCFMASRRQASKAALRTPRRPMLYDASVCRLLFACYRA